MEDVTGLVAELVATPSVNPDLVPDGGGEAAIAEVVADHLRAGGLEVHVEEAAPGRPNVVGVARGTGGGPSLLLVAHTDTVGVAGMADPFAAEVRDGRLYGRGAVDMKGGLAAIMVAGVRAARRPLAGDVIVAAVADEEFASVGAQALVRAWRADAAVVTEPTALDVCVAHRGFAWWDVEVEGFAAHGSRPEVGVDAIAKTGRLLTGVEELDRRLRAGEGHPYVGTGSVHASLIAGGQELSSYPERCRLQVERRTAPGETEAVVQAELDALLDAARAADPAFRATGRVTLVRDPFAVDPGERVVRGVRDAATAVLGRTPPLVGHGAWMDAAILSAAGIPTVVLGPAGDGHHGVEEWVDLASVQATVDVLDAAIATLCA